MSAKAPEPGSPEAAVMWAEMQVALAQLSDVITDVMTAVKNDLEKKGWSPHMAEQVAFQVTGSSMTALFTGAVTGTELRR